MERTGLTGLPSWLENGLDLSLSHGAVHDKSRWLAYSS
jgi:hypothetical protein